MLNFTTSIAVSKVKIDVVLVLFDVFVFVIFVVFGFLFF